MGRVAPAQLTPQDPLQRRLEHGAWIPQETKLLLTSFAYQYATT